MIPVKPPPLLPCLDASAPGHGLTQDDFRALFEYLYVDTHWYVTLPKGQAVRVRFRPRHCEHAFFKEPAEGQPRTIWQPDRAERILWIGYTVENPAEVRKVGVARLSLFCRMADHRTPWFVVVTDRRNGELDFVTAYPLTHDEYLKARRTGDILSRRQ
jgi:hypothetical protein